MTNTKQKILKKFDEEFQLRELDKVVPVGVSSDSDLKPHSTTLRKEFKSFISQAIDGVLEEAVEELRELRSEQKLRVNKKGEIVGTDYGEGWHGYAIKAIQKLNQLKESK